MKLRTLMMANLTKRIESSVIAMCNIGVPSVRISQRELREITFLEAVIRWFPFESHKEN